MAGNARQPRQPTRRDISTVPTTTDPNRFVSLNEAASYLGVSIRTVRGMLYDGRLTGHRLGERIVRIRLSDIDAAMTPYVEGR
jgi:excisionase family DNA binding protein